MEICPSDIKNYILNDPLIDFLKENPLYLKNKEKKSKYTSYLESKKHNFTKECIEYFKEKYQEDEIVDLSLEMDMKKRIQKTKDAIKNENINCIIYGGLIKDNLFAKPEIMIRSLKDKTFYITYCIWSQYYILKILFTHFKNKNNTFLKY